MSLSRTPARRDLQCGSLLLALLLALPIALLVSGCAGMEPYEARDEREEGPKQGLFTGSDGEFVILRSGRKPKPDKEKK
jgi:hypothetical protein